VQNYVGTAVEYLTYVRTPPWIGYSITVL